VTSLLPLYGSASLSSDYWTLFELIQELLPRQSTLLPDLRSPEILKGATLETSEGGSKGYRFDSI
jgi:hypothetical protein